MDSRRHRDDHHRTGGEILDLKQRRIVAFSFVMLMLAVPFTAIQLQDEEEDSEALPVFLVPIGAFVAQHWVGIGIAGSFGLGALSGWELHKHFNPTPDGPDEDELRKEEARLLARSLADGTSVYANALNNYQNIWSLTSEHWIRQAELASSSYWTPNSSYSPYDALTLSAAYYNSAVMLVNATNQINEQFSTVADHIGEWNSSDYSRYYGDGKMKLTFSIGSSSISAESADGFSARMGQVVGHGNDRVVKDGRTAVYYVGGPVYASAPATMTGANGITYQLSEGWNDSLPDVESWTGYNVYRLTPGVTYFGNFMYVKEADAAQVEGGLMVTAGGETMIVSCDGSYLYDGTSSYQAVDNNGYDLFKLSVVPQNEEDRQESDITAMMVYYAELVKQIDSVLSKANQAARVVWQIYDDAGSASMYLTTLNVPDTYENVTLTDEQKRLLVTLYMDQLSDWWSTYDGQIKKDNYYLTQDSMTLYCRGDLTMKGTSTDGSTTCKVYENVAFTPIFYKSTSLRTGSQETASQCFVLVYGQCPSLSGFDVASYKDCELLYLDPGSTIAVSEMYHDGKPVSNVDLKASQVDYIKAEDMEHFSPVEPHPENDMAELLRLILLIIGGACLAYGLGRGNPIAAVVGLILVVIGLVFAEGIADAIDRYIKFRFIWPW